MAPVKLECPVPDCTLGKNGGKYETTPLESQEAMQMLNLHLQFNHRQQGGDQQDPGGGGARTKVEKVPRPTLGKGLSEDKFVHFERLWKRYRRASSLTDEQQVRDQLLSCCNDELAEDLGNLFGDQLDVKTEEQLLMEMRRLAVLSQNHLVNIVRLRAMVQDRDEPIRTYLARLKGAAGVCNLTVRCSCDPSTAVSYSDKELLHCMVNGLSDKDIRNQVMGKVEVMDLETTIKFVEAKEAGKKAGDYLDNGDLNVNKLTGYKQSQREGLESGYDTPKEDVVVSEARCKYCNKKGHGSAPVLSKKREVCPAYDKKCNTCGMIGHFSRTKACKKRAVKVEMLEQYEMKHKSLTVMNEVTVLKDSKGKVVKLSASRPIPHMIDVDGKFIVAEPRAHPKLKVQVVVDSEVYKELGLFMRLRRSCMTNRGKVLQIPKMELLCDTGAQVDCMNVGRLSSLGLVKSELLQPEVTVGCANTTPAGVLGIFFGKVVAMEGVQRTEIRVMFYVLKNGGDILSRHTCERLRIIEPQFPVPESHSTVRPVKMDVFSVEDGCFQEPGVCDPDSELPCRCPRRDNVDPPDSLPMAATAENRERLEEWIKEYYKASAFSTCKRQLMPSTEGPPMKIHTRPGAVPHVIHKPVPVPLHYRKEVNTIIDANVKRGVMEKVPPGVADTWCAKMLVTPKKDGRPRVVIDLSHLTKAGVRETHHTRAPFKVVCSVPKGMVKTTLDCVDGYWGIPLAKEDQHKTTFLTERGRYRYLRVPQGYGSSNDGYTLRTDEILAGVPGRPEKPDYEKIVDDIIQWSPDIETAFFRVCAMLSHCSKAGMVFSAQKFVFAAPAVEYAGFLVGMESIQPTPKYLENILNFPTPQNIADVRSWFGLINQVAFAFSKGRVMAPFRDLLRPARKFDWTPDMDRAFNESKREIVRKVRSGVQMFDPDLVTCLSTDFCQTGLGWLLQQKKCKCRVISPVCCEDGWSLVLAGGRFTIPAETRYSPTEGESLAVVVGLESSKYYTLGCPRLYVATDHKPLLRILNDRDLDTIVNPRLLRLKERTLPWNFEMVYVPGTKQAAADTLSRKKTLVGLASMSVGDNGEGFEEFLTTDARSGLMIGVNRLDVTMEDTGTTVLTWAKLQEETMKDKQLVMLMEEIQRGIPDNRFDMHGDLWEFHKFRYGLLVLDNVVCYKNRVVVPHSLRPQVLEILHAAHQGVSGMINRAEQSVFWPGISVDINRTRSLCRTCCRNAPSQPAGIPVPPPSPNYPFELIAADYFHLDGWNYLVLGDRYSGWISIHKTGRGEYDTDRLIEALKEHFLCFGVAAELASDMGPQFKSSKLEKFLKQYGVHHRQSSAYFAHSNTKAELAVKTGKRLLRGNVGPSGELGTDRFLRAMLQYRNTPHPDTRLSPAQVVFGRQIKDFLPVIGHKYEPKQEWGLVREAREKAMARRLEKDGARLERYTKQQRMIPVGDSVAVQNQTGRFPRKWDKTGTVVDNLDHDKVRVRLDGSRQLTTRNRQFVRRIVSPPDLPVHDVQGVPSAAVTGSSHGCEKSDVDEDLIGQQEDQQVPGQRDDVAQGEGRAAQSGDMRNDGDMSLQSQLSDEVGGADCPGQPLPATLPINNRTQRERKQNVRYSATEYDLSGVSALPTIECWSGLGY